MYKLYEEGL